MQSINSLDQLVSIVQADINSEKEARRKARNKRKALRRKLREVKRTR